MIRSFVATETKDGVKRTGLRRARDGEQLFRGTPRYCSMAMHERKELVRLQ